MYRPYKTTAAILIALLSVKHSFAQTHYGIGVGTQGAGHAFYGTSAGKVNVGENNTFLGYNSGKANVGGAFNTFVGFNSGYNNTAGAKNTFIGNFAGLSNLTGGQRL